MNGVVRRVWTPQCVLWGRVCSSRDIIIIIAVLDVRLGLTNAMHVFDMEPWASCNSRRAVEFSSDDNQLAWYHSRAYSIVTQVVMGYCCIMTSKSAVPLVVR